MADSGAGTYVNVAQARAMLGISMSHMAKLLHERVLQWERNPIDRRGKILRRAEVEALAAKLPKAAA